MDVTTVAAHRLVRAFVVDHAAAGAHPLDLARTHGAGVAETVLVPLAAFQQQGQGLDTGVRVRRGALRFARPDVDRAELIEENEGADGLVGIRRNGPADFEPIAFEGFGKLHGPKRRFALSSSCETLSSCRGRM